MIERFRAYYRRVGWSWGSLHIVLCDQNLEDHSVRFCARYAQEHGDSEGLELAGILLKMSKTQRSRIQPLIVNDEGYPDRTENVETLTQEEHEADYGIR